jgi:hypothetical protein
MNFFGHKDLGNHLLQLCPKVVKHPVFSTPCSQTPSVYVPLNIRNQVSHPYRTTGIIIVLYILICMRLDSRREGSTLFHCWEMLVAYCSGITRLVWSRRNMSTTAALTITVIMKTLRFSGHELCLHYRFVTLLREREWCTRRDSLLQQYLIAAALG